MNVNRVQSASRADFEIMLARTKARARGASPVEVQRNVNALTTEEPADCLPRTVGIRNGAWSEALS